jgi:ABC-type nitrate/sulfonate/bicarbonate transport system permease component
VNVRAVVGVKPIGKPVPSRVSVATEEHAPRRNPFASIRARVLSKRMALVTLSWLVGIAIWEIYGRRASKFSFASASDTFAALQELASNGVLWKHTQISFRELAIAFVVGSIIGIVGGTIAGMSWTFRTVTENWVTVGLALPFAAIFPLLLVQFGLGEASKVALGVFACVMPVWGNTRVGIESVDKQLIEMTRSLDGKTRHIVRYVVLPWALPSIIEGLRFGLTRAFLAVIVGEMLASRGGLGYLISVSGDSLQMDKLLAAVVVVTVITLVIVHALSYLQHRLVPWWDRNN